MSQPDYDQADWYDSPLYYDIIFDQNTAQEADFIEALCRRHGRPIDMDRKHLRILEPACGTGRLMVELARRGHHVAGFDLNAAMLKTARERLRNAGCRGSLKRASLQDFSIRGSFDVAHCLLSTFKYILEDEGAVSHLQRVAGHLRRGGLYVLGIHLADYSRNGCEHERWVGERDGVHVVCNTRTWPPNRRTRQEKLRTRLRVRHVGEDRERRLETHWHCRTYSSREIFRTLAKVPSLAPVAYYDFHHDIKNPKRGHRNELRDDVVFVLQKA